MPDTAPTPDSDPQIQQDVKGDRDQVIGRVDKSIIIQSLTINLTIDERIPLESALTPRSTGQAQTPQEYRQRKILLNKVKEFWVTGVLETSLYKRILIELGQKERLDLVQRPFSSVGEFAESARQTLPDGSNITTYFERMETGRTLLIVGEPGSGKTITLLKLAEDLIVRTEQDLLQPIPVVFNLSSWARKQQSIEDWLLQELLEKYHVPTAFGKAWVESESLILLVDGLDEVKVEHRNACVQGLNKFLQNHGTTDLIVCCRIKDYQLLDKQLTLRRAIWIQPLNSEQIINYLDLAGDQLAPLKAVLLNNSELSELATSPLILSIMSLTYQGCSLEMPQRLIQQEHQCRKLFDAYIERMFDRRKNTQTYKKTKTKSWLTWLAQQMNKSSETIFLIESLQPSFLKSRFHKGCYRIFSGLIGGTIYGISDIFIRASTNNFSDILLNSLCSGIIFGVIIGSLSEIRTIETLSWSWNELKKGLKSGLFFGFFLTLPMISVYGIFVLKINLFQKNFIFAILFIGLIVGLFFGFLGGVFGGFRGPKIPKKEYPNQGIFASARNALILGSMVGLIWGLIRGLNAGLNYGLIAGLIGGGTACFQHLILRLVLYMKGYIPFDYSHFLDYATDRLFGEKVGGGYIFVHRMLMEHFAEMSLEQKRR